MRIRSAVLLFALVPAVQAVAAPGDVDMTFAFDTFAPGWRQFFSVGIRDDRGVALARTPDGGYVALYAADDVHGGREIGLMRMDGDGAMVTSFGTFGRRQFDRGLTDICDMIVDSAGRIVVAGTVPDATGGSDFALLRFNPDGSDDTDFSADGMMTAGFDADGASEDVAAALVLQPTPTGFRYVLAGNTTRVDGMAPASGALLGVRANGTPDPAFGNLAADGRSLVVFDAVRPDHATALVVTPENWLVVGGWRAYDDGDTDIAATLMTPAGFEPAGSAGNYRRTYAADIAAADGSTRDGVTAMAMSGADAVALVGDAGGHMVALRMRVTTTPQAMLTLDTSFVGSGVPARASMFVGAHSNAHAAAVAVDAKGNLLIAGSYEDPLPVGALQRVFADGSVPIDALRGYRAPANIGSIAYFTRFERITLDAGRPLLYGTASATDMDLTDVDGFAVRLVPEPFVERLFDDQFE